MGKGKRKSLLPLVFLSLVGCLFLYWVFSYQPSGDFFRLDETTNASNKLEALTKALKEDDTKSSGRSES